MKKIINLAVVLLATSASAASFQWQTKVQASFDGTRIIDQSATAILIYLGSTFDSTATYTIAKTDDLESLASSIGTKTDSTATSTAGRQLANGTYTGGVVNGTYNFETGVANGDLFAVLVSHVVSGVTYYTLSAPVAASYDSVSQTWSKITPEVNWGFSGADATASKSGSLAVGGGWTAVPEPSTAMLALAGLALLIKRRRA